jgi:DNA-directed RNA polymerase specialized sigma subunit
MQGSAYEDAISNGAIGISEGLDRWNPNMSSLTSYVWIAIRRNVLNGNRKDWNKGLTGNYYENKNLPPVTAEPTWTFNNGSDSQETARNRFDEYVEEDMTQAEAGLIIGRTQQRVDQIHREALEVLRSIYL